MRLCQLFVLLAALMPAPLWAQMAPKIEYLFPAGGQRGTQVEVELAADFVPAPCGLSIAGEGVHSNSQDVTDRFAVTIAPDAAIGPRDVRLFVPQGGSSPFPFLIGELPEIVHHPGNATAGEPLKLPLTINGRLTADREIHTFKLQLAAGQQIVAACECNKFSSPLDPFLRVRSASSEVLAESFAHRSAQSLLVFRAPEQGEYTLEIFDFQLSGGPQYIYRLSVTDGPWLDYAWPAGLPAKSKSQVTLFGWNLPGQDGRQCTLEVESGEPGTCDIVLPGSANRLVLPVSQHSEVLEQEPNDTPEQAHAITLPVTINGRLQTAGDQDHFRFTAKKGDRLALDVAAADLNFPTDPVLTIFDAMGKQLSEMDDTRTSRDPSIRYTVPADGDYVLRVTDRVGRGGEEFLYRLTVAPPTPRLEAFVDIPAFSLLSGETKNLAVKVVQTDGVQEDLEVVAVNLPPGITCEPQPVGNKPTAAVQLPLTAAEKLGPTSGLVQVLVRSTAADSPVVHTALVRENAKATSGTADLWVAVSPEIPFTLSTTGEIVESPRLAAFPFPVTVERQEGFQDAIKLIGVERDTRGTVVPLEGEIPAGENSGGIPLIVQHNTTEGTTHRCRVMGVAEVTAADGQKYPVFHVAGGRMSLGCQPGYLTAGVPPMLQWQAGQTRELQVHLARRMKMDPVTVRLELPSSVSGVACDPVVVPNNDAVATLTLKFAPDAKLPPRVNGVVLAESAQEGLPIYARAEFRLEMR